MSSLRDIKRSLTKDMGISEIPVVIRCGGKGTRLRSITGSKIPKTMVECQGYPFLYWLLKDLARRGFRLFILSTGYKSKVIERYPWDRFVPQGVEMKLIRDESLRGESLEAVLFRDYEYFLQVNGDTLYEGEIPSPSSLRFIFPIHCEQGHTGMTWFCRGARGTRILHTPGSFQDIGTPERFKEFLKTLPS